MRHAVRVRAVLVAVALAAALLVPAASASITTNEAAPALRRTIGGQRTGVATLGELAGIADVAIAPGGDVYVADRTSNRIVRFTASGTYVTRWGGDPSVGTAGELLQPAGVAVGASGDVYVADTGHSRVVRFQSDGTFVSAWGDGNDAVDLQSPNDVAVAPDGNVFVLENNQVHRYSGAGVHEAAWGSCCDAAPLVSAQGIAAAPDGSVYVTSYDRQLVHHFSSSGTHLGSWGGFGTGPGQFKAPSGIGVAADGTVYVADRTNGRIQRFDAAGSLLGSWASAASGLALASSGQVLAGEGFTVERFTAAGSSLGSWGQPGDGLARFDSPFAVAATANGGLVVADRGSHQVALAGPDNFFGTEIGGDGTGPGQFHSPHGVAVAPDGRIFVADSGNNRVQRLAPDGSFERAWGSFGPGPGQFNFPFAVAVDAAGQVWVADQLNHRVERFDRDGNLLGAFGGFGAGPGQFGDPTAIAVSTDGVFVADRDNRRIQRFTSTGTFVAQWPTADAAAPFGLALDGRGGLWVTTSRAGGMTLTRYTLDGVRLTSVQTSGGAGGVLVHPNGRLYLADHARGTLVELVPAGGALVTVELTALSPSAQVGQRVDYQLRVQNTGTVPLTGVQVAYSGTPECDGPLPDLAPRDVQVVTCSHLVAPGDVGNFANQASVTSAQISSAVQSAQAPAVVTVTYAEPRLLGTIGSPGTGQGQLLDATALDVGPAGEVVVANRRSSGGPSEVDVFQPEGGFVRRFDTVTFGEDVALGPDGRVYIAGHDPSYASFVTRFTATGAAEVTLGATSPGPISDLDVQANGHVFTLHRPVQLCHVDPDLGEICEWRGNSDWTDLDASGSVVRTAAVTLGSSIAVSATRVYTATSSPFLNPDPPNRLQAHDAGNGALLGTTIVGSPAPRAVALDPFGNLVVGFANPSELRVYSPSGVVLARWPATADDVAVGADGSILALDSAAGVVRVYGFGIMGVVADEVTDAPLGGVVAIAVDATGQVAAASVSAADGSYRLRVGPGQYRVVFVDPSGGHLGEWAWGHAVTDPTSAAPVTVGVTGATVDIGLLSARGSVTGTVSGDGGGAVPGAWVAAIGQGSGLMRGTVAAGDGTYSLGEVDPGGQVVVFVDPSGQRRFEFFDDKAFAPSADPVAVVAGAASAASAALPAQGPFGSGSTISGTVVDDDAGGTAVAGAWVVGVRADGVMRAGAVTDAAGQFSLAVGPGSYKVQVLDPAGLHTGQWVPDRGLDDFDGAQVVPVGPGETATVDAGLESNRGRIAGTVNDPSGPAAGAVVLAISTANGQLAGAATAAGNGSYVIGGLRPGSYLVAFVDPWGEHGFEYHDNTPNPSAATPVVVTAGGAATINADLS